MTHGTGSGYAKYGCRCAECTAAQRARMREYRKHRTNVKTSGTDATTLGTTQIGPSDVGASSGRGPEPLGGPERA